MQKYWRHAVLITIGILLLVSLQWVGAMVLPTILSPADQTISTLTLTLPMIEASPSASPTVASTPPIPVPSQAEWPQVVATPLDVTAVVNKKYVLAATFVPPDLRLVKVPHTNNHPLRVVAATALEQMVTAAANDTVHLRLLSGYRSYSTQKNLYNSYVKNDGPARADRYSARPGHSEHQLGLALDIGDADATGCDITACFADTAGGQWVTAHASDYGFIIRYKAAKEEVTGYMAEPWHLRYVGVDLAKVLAGSGQTLEEYFGLAGGSY